MRDIKFRGKTKIDNEWIIGSYFYTNDNKNNPFRRGPFKEKHQILFYCAGDWNLGGWNFEEVNKETIGQFTGLKDKNGKEIYEGDIIHIKEFANEALNVDFSSDDIRQLSLDDCKGKLLKEYKCIISFIDGNMMAKMISKEDCELYISALFPDMRYSQPIFEFETIGNIHDNIELIKEE